MTSALAKDVAEENKLVTIKEENQRRQKREQIKPLRIAFTNPNSPLAYQVRFGTMQNRFVVVKIQKKTKKLRRQFLES